MQFRVAFVSTRACLLVWLGILTTYRILSLLQPQMSLFFDEAYYFHWSQALDFGYYSKPPMVAWCIAFFSHLFGVSEFSVKIGAPVLYFFSSLLIYEIGLCCVSRRAALYAAIIFSSTPIVGFNSLFITTDSPLIFFWALTTLLALKCLQHNKPVYWLLLGLALGSGMLSKYSFAALPFGLLLFIAIGRRLDIVKNPFFWLSIGIGLLLASTNLYWNWQHGFVSYAHTNEISHLDQASLKPLALLTFLLSQILIFGLVWFIAIVKKWHLVRHSFSQAQYLSLLVCSMLPLLIVISLQALLSRAFANWSAPFIIPASIIAGVAVSYCRPRVLAVGCAVNLVLLSLIYHWPQLQSLAQVEASAKNSPYYRLMGWENLGRSVKPILAKFPSAYLLSDSRELLAYIGFYSDTPAAALYFWNAEPNHVSNHYDLVRNVDITTNTSQAFLLITKTPPDQALLSRFQSFYLVAEHKLSVNSDLTRTVYIYHVADFKGYNDEH